MAERKGAEDNRGELTARERGQRRRRAIERRRADKAARKQARDLEAAAAGGPLTGAAKTIENAEMYKAVYADWLMGLSYDDLAEEHGVSASRCEQIVRSLRGARLDLLKLDSPTFGIDAVRDLILKMTASVSEYAKLARETKQDSVKLGAMRRRDERLDEYRELLQELGILPKHLGTLRIQQDFLEMMDTLLEKMDQLGIDQDTQRALVEAVELRAVQREGDDRLSLATGAIDVEHEEVDGAATAA